MSYERRTITHGGGVQHLEGDACPYCHDVSRVIVKGPERYNYGYVVLNATAVHTHDCKYWRLGKSHGPCTCGANDLWESVREEMTERVYAK
jgi:hypothetical protein